MRSKKEKNIMSDTFEKNKVEGGTLYLVATPIGNLSDISARALKVLSEVDAIAAEDTRNSAKLLTYFGIQKPLVSYHEHNKAQRGAQIVSELKAGKSYALVTDAGTPAISDPGADLVALCALEGVPVTSIPGACAAICALTLSALPTDRFCFEGFLPTKNSERKERLSLLQGEIRTVIFHEAPHKLRGTLDDLAAYFGKERRIALCREMTKLNEEIFRTTIGGAIEHYSATEPRGEYVLVMEGATSAAEGNFWKDMTVVQHVEHYMASGMDKNTAIKTAAHDRGVAKNVVYQEFIKS